MNHQQTSVVNKFRHAGFLVLVALGLLSVQNTYAQDEKIKFGAYGRALQQTDRLGSGDTLNVDHVSSGSVLMDFGFKVTPDKKTEIQAVMRLRSELGSFYGGGDLALLRWVYVRGIIAKTVNYEVGDIRLQLSPYTFYNSESEGQINEASVFRDFRRDYVYYENFNKGNSWWQQGAHTDFAIGVKSSFLDQIKVDAFFVRNRSTAPAAFHGGGRLSLLKSDRYNFAVNYVNLFEIGSTLSDTATYSHNPVNTYELNVVALNKPNFRLSLFGESGFSKMLFYKDEAATKNVQGAFGEGGFLAEHKPTGLSLKASFRTVDPYFISSAAQTKRVNFANDSNALAAFPVYGNDPFNANFRSVGLFDLVQDPNVMNRQIQWQLMAFNPIYGNATPYGTATPNRRGFDTKLTWLDKKERINVSAAGSFLSEIQEEGSADQLRSFTVLSGTVDLYINKMIGWEKKILLHGGIRSEQTSRSGDTLTAISLNTMLMDAGVEVEVFRRLDALAGIKTLTAEGNEIISLRNRYGVISNYDIESFRKINVDQSMIGYGLKYRFSTATYLTAQHHLYSLTDNAVKERSIDFDRFNIMFNLSF